jgi:hypothetical protein
MLGTRLGAGDFVGRSESSLLGFCDAWELDEVSDGDLDGVWEVDSEDLVSEGNPDGNWVGVSDRDLDGVLDGVSEGISDGNSEGNSDGYSDGNSDGSSDGTSEFNAEGLLLATEVGSAVDSPLCSSTFTVVAIRYLAILDSFFQGYNKCIH